jgi:predicted transcriptional regulator
MATVKESAIQIINALPKNAKLDVIMEELYFKAQVDEGLAQLNSGKGVPNSTVKNRLSKWIKK